MAAADFTTQPFRLSRGDIAGLSVRLYYTRMFTFPAILFYGVFIFLLPVLGNYRAMLQHRYMGFWETTAIFALLWLVIIPGLSLGRTLVAGLKSGISKAERTITIGEDGVHLESAILTTTFAWRNVGRARSFGRFLILDNGAAAWQVVPKAAFASPEDAKKALLLAQRHIANAKHKQVGAFYVPEPEALPSKGLPSPPFILTGGAFLIGYCLIYWQRMFRGATPFIVLIVASGFSVWFAREAISIGAWGYAARMVAGIMAGMVLVSAVIGPAIAAATWLTRRKKPAFLAPRQIILTQYSFIATGLGFNVNLAWTLLYRVRRIWGVMMFYTQPAAAVLLPMSAFPDNTAAQAFFDQATAYFNAAKTAAAKSTLDG